MQYRDWRGCGHLLLVVAALISVAGCRMNIEARRTGSNETTKDLFAAVEDGRQNTVSKLIENHPQWVDSRSDLGNSPLFIAAYHGHHGVAEVLIDAGASVDNGGSGEMAPLHAAAIRGHMDIVNLLLAAGANANVQDSQGRTPLFFAAQEGHAEVAEVLLSSGANHSLADSQGHTPLDAARGREHARVVDLLTRSAVR